jgi:hypothetical protein
MDRATFDALLAPAGGRELVWGLLERERAAAAAGWDRERAAWDRERAAWDRERAAHAAAAAGWDRERALLLEREELSVAAVQKQLDFAHGLVTVRAALEGIVSSRFPNTSVTDALKQYTSAPDYMNYLEAVSVATGFSAPSLAKAAKDAYGSLSATVHGGSTHVSDGGAVPAAVLGDHRTLYGVAAIFKLARRDIRFYIGGSGVTIKLPSPGHSPPGSAEPSPPKAPGGAAGGTQGQAESPGKAECDGGGGMRSLTEAPGAAATKSGGVAQSLIEMPGATGVGGSA